MKSRKIIKLVTLFLLVLCQIGYTNPYEEIVDLSGSWKFSIGDLPEWKNPEYNDSDWLTIDVPGYWEAQGFAGYNGFAWYRKSFSFSYNTANTLHLVLSRIDDVDEVFFNGVKIGGQGSFLPEYSSAYFMVRKYEIPQNLIRKNGRNVIAIRVFDGDQTGGIAPGNVGIYTLEYPLSPNIDLSGVWKFRIGDNLHWKNFLIDETDWRDMFVPDTWFGFELSYYDGMAWYRKSAVIPANLKNEKLYLLLGKIDDLDETFFNEQFIGNTGYFADQIEDMAFDGDEYTKIRAYHIPSELIRWDEKNIIAVRVFDGFRDGGIYEGPIGIMTEKRLYAFLNNIDDDVDRQSTWSRIFRLFD